MDAKEILAATRRAISECAGSDPDRLFYVNRFVFARLQVDERKTKTKIKKELLDADSPSCGYSGCTHGGSIESRRGIHLHRRNTTRGYSRDNCVLMHADCHTKYHAEHPPVPRDETSDVDERDAGSAILEKESKRYEGQRFLYWWDLSPGSLDRLDRYEAVEFLKKDTGERCHVPVPALKGYLTEERRTNRHGGNWGIKVLKEEEDQLAFEPGVKTDRWLYLPVVWFHEEQED
ncbi:MAG: hypothetical protein NTZ17_08240 [Phycisphaerae bacterium]|nr:hypothetical protein [Phycisphaerae bacterium]